MMQALMRKFNAWKRFAPGVPARRARGRLLRRTFVVALLLVSVGLVSSGALELYFRYRESVQAIGTLQREMAKGAAFKIQQFVRDIEKTMRASTQTRETVTQGLTEGFRFNLIKLMKVAPAITTVRVIDANGKETMMTSRVELVDSKEFRDRTSEEAYGRARKGATYFGPVYYVRQSEPHMRIAIPIELFVGDVIGVMIAEVNLKYIRQVITQIKVGKAGYAYVVTREGDLIAHPDISLVLQKRDLKHLGQVQAAINRTRGTLDPQPNLAGQTVFPAYAAIPDLGWAVLVERPSAEATAPLYASIMRTSLLLLVGLIMALLASLVIGRRIVLPLRVLRQGASRIGAGELTHRIEVRTGDELEGLAEEFNHMAAQLQEERAGLEENVAERTRELSEALEQQTATAEILRVISESPTELQPVFDTILENACRLCEANLGILLLFDGQNYTTVAYRGCKPETVEFIRQVPLPIEGTTLEQMVREPRNTQVDDASADAAYTDRKSPLRKVFVDTEGARTFLQVPMLRQGQLAGVIVIYRREVRRFSHKQVAILETFAQQAVIAIENSRLFEQLQDSTQDLAQSVSELQALQEVGQTVSSTLDLQTVLTTVVSRAVQISNTDGGVISEYEEDSNTFQMRASHNISQEQVDVLRKEPMQMGEGASGRAAASRGPVQVPDMTDESIPMLERTRHLLTGRGYRSLLAVPLLLEERVLGVLVVWRRQVGEFDEGQVNLLQTFATQSTLAIQNARLFREIEERGREVEIASKHKSQFLANMSHELRTPLNAILGYTELILDDIYGQVPEKVHEVLARVQISGKHLLGLINAVLDLSKIEAGQFSLAYSDYSMQEVVQTVVTSVESLAAEKKLTLEVNVPQDLPLANGDEQRITQVLLNLIGNAIKFTDSGTVGICVKAENGEFEVAVSDTGPGIAEAEQEAIFGEFQQADTSDTKNLGGTGLGLAIAKKLVEMHKGRIWVQSSPGEGSTFSIALPIGRPAGEDGHEQANLGD